MTESGRRGKANEISDSRSGFKGMSIEGEKLDGQLACHVTG